MPALLRMAKNLLQATSLLGVVLAAGCNDHRPNGPIGPDAPLVVGPVAPLGPDVSGVVVDPFGLAVGGAAVEVTDGPLAGRSTTTDQSGRFLLAGVQSAGSVTLRVSKAGYTELSQPSALVSGPESTVRVMLWPVPRSTVAPTYTLTLTADSACSGLPPDVQARSYSAVLQADHGPNSFIMPLGGADFYPTQRVIWGASEAELRIYFLSLEASDRWLEDDPIVESLGGTRYLAVMGTVVTKFQAPAQSLTATFDGTFSYCSKGAPNPTFFQCAVSPVECRSSNHQLRITTGP
jgi:hypothetical protein